MKKYLSTFKLVAIFLFVAFKTVAQTKIELIFTSDKPMSEVNIMDVSQKNIYHTAYHDTVTAEFKKINFIELYTINCHVNDKIRWTQIWLEPGNVKIYAHVDSAKLIIDTVINAPFYYYEKSFRNELADFKKTHDTTQVNNFLLSKIRENIDNPFSLNLSSIYLFLNGNNKDKLYDLKETLSKQNDKFSWHVLHEVIDKMNNTLLVDRINVSDYNFINTGGKAVPLVLKGADYYILDFWFLGCTPCRRDHAVMKQQLLLLTQKKIGIVSISTDAYNEYGSQWKAYLLKNKYTWPNYLQAGTKKIKDSLGFSATPYYVLIKSNGEIIGRYESFVEIFKKFNIENKTL